MWMLWMDSNYELSDSKSDVLRTGQQHRAMLDLIKYSCQLILLIDTDDTVLSQAPGSHHLLSGLPVCTVYPHSTSKHHIY